MSIAPPRTVGLDDTALEDMVQLLTPEGVRREDPRYDAADLSPDTLRGMYRDMVLVRRFDTEATALQRQGELGLWAQSLGQEAAQIGSGYALRPQDYVFPAYREHGVALTRGVELTDLLQLFRGIDHGGWDPVAHRFHLYTLVIGAHTLHATGYAMAMQRDGAVGTGDPDRDSAVVVYFGDGATSQGDVHEAMVFAATTNAPVVFFCQNNQWAISEPTTVQSNVPLHRRADGYGIPNVRVDGNDVIASHAVTADALRRARSGGGPTFIEAYTYRMGAHTTSDDPSRYRSSAEEEHWRQRDPIDRLRTYLLTSGLIDDAWLADLAGQAETLGEHVRSTCRAMTRPPVSSMFDHVYSAPHTQVEADREWSAEYLAAFAADDHGHGGAR